MTWFRRRPYILRIHHREKQTGRFEPCPVRRRGRQSARRMHKAFWWQSLNSELVSHLMDVMPNKNVGKTYETLHRLKIRAKGPDFMTSPLSNEIAYTKRGRSSIHSIIHNQIFATAGPEGGGVSRYSNAYSLIIESSFARVIILIHNRRYCRLYIHASEYVVVTVLRWEEMLAD